MDSRNEQLNKWIKGESWHNPEFDECCPDFSCCGHKIADKEVRIAFKEAYDEKNYKLMEKFCFDFLKGLIAQHNLPGFVVPVQTHPLPKLTPGGYRPDEKRD